MYSEKSMAVELAKRMKKRKSYSLEISISPMQICDTLERDYAVCDNNRREKKCTNGAEYCCSPKTFTLEIHRDSLHYHVCSECAVEAIRTNKESKW